MNNPNQYPPHNGKNQPLPHNQYPQQESRRWLKVVGGAGAIAVAALAVSTGAAKSGALEKLRDEFVGEKYTVGAEVVRELEGVARSKVNSELEAARNNGMHPKGTSGGFEVVDPNAAGNQEPAIEVSGRREWASVTTHSGPVSVEYRFRDVSEKITPDNIEGVLGGATFDNVTVENESTDEKVQVTLQDGGVISVRGTEEYANPTVALHAAQDVIDGSLPARPVDLDDAGWGS